MMAELERIFNAQQQNGEVSMEYMTHIYYGRLDATRNAG
jgi:hypothetical protein